MKTQRLATYVFCALPALAQAEAGSPSAFEPFLFFQQSLAVEAQRRDAPGRQELLAACAPLLRVSRPGLDRLFSVLSGPAAELAKLEMEERDSIRNAILANSDGVPALRDRLWARRGAVIERAWSALRQALPEEEFRSFRAYLVEEYARGIRRSPMTGVRTSGPKGRNEAAVKGK